MAVLSYQQTLAAVWGLLFGVLTLSAAVLAAFYAGIAASATRESNYIAQQTAALEPEAVD